MAGKPQGRGDVSREEFAQNLAESGLFDAADLLPDTREVDGASIARELVNAGKLTDYQAAAVLSRRFDELRMGNYEILARLGQGGMGTVYKARHRRMKRVVALKVLSKEVAGEESFARRFQREVETIAQLSHPNIVMAFDADEGEAGPFLVMEFVDGRDLASEVEQRGPLPVADAVDRILQAARGLAYAHAQGIIHRDVKPGNLLRDADGVVKVADLGLARLNTPAPGNTSLTEAGTAVGTADYMAPEQALDAGVIDHRVDVYALGCTLFYLLTAGPLYQAGTIIALFLKHRDAPIPSLTQARPDVPPGLDALFRRMVAKAADDRYRTMAAVAAELEQIQARLGPAAAPAPARPAPPATAAYDTLGSPSADTGAFEVSPAGPAAANVATVSVPTGLKVIVTEPSRTQAGIIRRYLQQLGVTNVQAAGSGQEALELARRSWSCVIISAMHLPDMTGVQLARTVLADPACDEAAFVLATSEADHQEPGAIPDNPRVVVMPKPFDPQRLAHSLAAVVR
jgi:serine/threonine-protein kinase